MPAIRRPRRRAVPAAVLGALALAACTGPTNAPTGYNDTVKANFLATCTGNVPPIDNTTTTLASTAYCECAYQVYVDNVPYDDNDKKSRFPSFDGATFVQLEVDLKSNPSDPPEAAKKTLNIVNPKLDACPKGSETTGSVPATAPGTTPGTTVPGGDATTGTTAPERVGPLAPTTVS